MQKILQIKILLAIFLYMACQFCFAAAAQQNVQLIDVQNRSLPGNKAQIMLEFSGTPPSPQGFSLSDPAQMIFDFIGISNNLPRKVATQKISSGVITGMNFISSTDRTRLVLDVLNIVPYSIDIDRNKIILTLENDIKVKNQSIEGKYTIASLDFRRGESGEGRVIVDFNGQTVPIDFSEDEDQVTIQFRGATIAPSLIRKFDVNDFGTNIQSILIEQKNNDVIMHIYSAGNYDKVAYQSGKQYIFETRPMTATSLSALKTQKFKFTGEKISLNFQDIPIRSVLQLIADFTNLNIVVSDSVQGNLTLRLEDVPWDQALDFILQSKGLAKRESDGVILIAPAEEIAAREQLQLEAQQQVQSLAPLEQEYIQINFAKAADMVTIIKDAENNLLSSRGQISVDDRTNILLVKDTAENIINIRQLIERLDIPVRQVIIEAQIVQTTDSLSDDLGVKLNGAATPRFGKYTLGMAPTGDLARTFADNPSSKTTSTGTTTDSTTVTTTATTTSSSTSEDELFFDFSGAGLAQLGLALARLPGGTLLDLELHASEVESKSKTIARPKLMTLDQQSASIETGQEIPYTVTAQAGATPTTEFKKAVLSLNVTPQITPNNKIAMELTISRDSPGDTLNGQSAINTTSMTTNVLVDDGETIVLGGIFDGTETFSTNSVPYLSKIPIIGQIFRSKATSNSRSEILIFVTPRIVKSMFEH